MDVALILCITVVGIIALGNCVCWYLFFSNANLWIKHGDKEITLNSEMKKLSDKETENKTKIENLEKKVDKLIEVIEIKNAKE